MMMMHTLSFFSTDNKQQQVHPTLKQKSQTTNNERQNTDQSFYRSNTKRHCFLWVFFFFCHDEIKFSISAAAAKSLLSLLCFSGTKKPIWLRKGRCFLSIFLCSNRRRSPLLLLLHTHEKVVPPTPSTSCCSCGSDIKLNSSTHIYFFNFYYFGLYHVSRGLVLFSVLWLGV